MSRSVPPGHSVRCTSACSPPGSRRSHASGAAAVARRPAWASRLATLRRSAALRYCMTIEWKTTLATPAAGVASVVFHSIVMQYLSAADRRSVASLLAQAGRRATAAAPLAWLRLEPGGEQAEVHLTLWPGGTERLIASAGFNGRPVRWLA